MVMLYIQKITTEWDLDVSIASLVREPLLLEFSFDYDRGTGGFPNKPNMVILESNLVYW